MRARGDLERAVMDVVWSVEGAVTGREVLDRLGDSRLAYTTVMTILGRLVRKGLVRGTLIGNVWHYAAATSRERYISQLMLEALDRAGSREAALMHFARSVRSASEQDAATLREALSRRADPEERPDEYSDGCAP
jgi:BlaI family transcriptional regulator, penicillinase repressor